MNLKTRIHIEKTVVRQIVKSALALGYSVSVDNGGDDVEISKSTDYDKIDNTLFATDDETLYFHSDDACVGWVYLVYGSNGYDVVADYATSVSVLKKAFSEAVDIGITMTDFPKLLATKLKG